MAFNHIVLTEFDNNEGIIVDLNAKKYYRLNETALLIWKGIEKRRQLEEIVNEVVDAYEVTNDQARMSVENLCRELEEYRLMRA